MADIFTSGAATSDQAGLFGATAGSSNSTGTPSSTSANNGIFGLGNAGNYGSTGSYIGAAGDLFSDVGSAVGGFMAYQGAKSQAELYGQAAELAGENATEEIGATQLKEVQQRRQIAMAIGTQQADVGANGFTAGGSALDLLKASQQQGALAVAMTGIQGKINEDAFRRQQEADLAMQQQAKQAAGGGVASMIGGIVKAVGLVAMLA